jgi:hypothetical protein
MPNLTLLYVGGDTMVMNGPPIRLPPKLACLACSDDLLNHMDLTQNQGLSRLPTLQHVNIMDHISDWNLTRLANAWGRSLIGLDIITDNVRQTFDKFTKLTTLYLESLAQSKSDFRDMFGKLPLLEALHMSEVDPACIRGLDLPPNLKDFSLSHSEERMTRRVSGLNRINHEITFLDLPNFPPDMASIKFKVENYDAGTLLSLSAVSTILESMASPAVFKWSCHHSCAKQMLAYLEDQKKGDSVRLTGVAVSTTYQAVAPTPNSLGIELVDRAPTKLYTFSNAVQFKFVAAPRSPTV